MRTVASDDGLAPSVNALVQAIEATGGARMTWLAALHTP
jgi:hypothetical protein